MSRDIVWGPSSLLSNYNRRIALGRETDHSPPSGVEGVEGVVSFPQAYEQLYLRSHVILDLFNEPGEAN